MTGDFKKIKDGSYRMIRKNGKGYEYYTKGVCEQCGKFFYKRKHKSNKFCSYKCSDESKKNLEEIFLTKNDLDIVNGSLLSDGHLRRIINNQNSSFTHSCKFEEYIDFFIKQFSFELTKFKGKNNSGFDYYTINSKANVFFTNLRKKWYPNDVKIVPKDIELNQTTILHWYLGDGTLDNQVGAVFCTDSFTKEDNKFLIEKLNCYNFDAFLKETVNRIIIPNKKVFEFLNFIGISPVVCYNHKWDSIVHESYLNRTCGFCGEKFDTEYNHKKYCSDNCQKKQWKINKDKKEDLAHTFV